MATIGTFKKSGAEFLGQIVTLNVQTKSVRIIPEANRTSENAPSHRIFVGRAEVGAAWSKRSAEQRDYLSVKLDDPSFNAPIYANLVQDEEGKGYALIWSPQPQGQRRLRPIGDALPGTSGRQKSSETLRRPPAIYVRRPRLDSLLRPRNG